MKPQSRRLAWMLVHCSLVWACLAPLLGGGFLFDDPINLKALGEYGPIRDLAGLSRYLTAGIADPLGRPVAMASFLIDARDWPAPPAPFLRSNLILHLANSLLLYWLLVRLATTRHLPVTQAEPAALAAASLWALHPLWVSTVGYVVQRHAMLATSFVLLGLIVWIIAISEFRQGCVRRGWLWAVIAFPLCGLLAAFSKANGVLLPLLASVLYFFWLPDGGKRSPAEKWAVRLCLGLPSILMVVALLWVMEPHPAGRPWSLAERLLSQPRALVDYLLHLVTPRVNSTGLFADGFQVSTSWSSPATTAPAALFVAALLALPFLVRRRQPALATAVAFFFAGHVVESTVLPLELYFEHRNYLPAILLGWPLTLHLLAPPSGKRMGGAVLLLLICVLGITTFTRANLWADQPRQAAVWALTQPGSARAQTWAAQHEIEAGNLEAAKTRLQSALEEHPGNAMLAVNLLDVECAQGTLRVSTIRIVSRALAEASAAEDVPHRWLRDKIESRGNLCPTLPDSILADLLQALAGPTPENPVAKARRHRLQGSFALRQGRCPEAAAYFRESQEAQRWASEAYADTAMLASQCGPEAALEYLQAFEAHGGPDAKERPGMLRVHKWVLAHQGYWQDELGRLREMLEQERTDLGGSRTVDGRGSGR